MQGNRFKLKSANLALNPCLEVTERNLIAVFLPALSTSKRDYSLMKCLFSVFFVPLWLDFSFIFPILLDNDFEAIALSGMANIWTRRQSALHLQH